jgi:hypothetical protein
MSVSVRFLSAALALALCGASSAFAQSLGDVAKREQQRRKAAKASDKVYTNKDLGPGGTNPAPATLPPPTSTTAGPGGAEPAAAASEKAEEQDPKKTEQYWRERLETARAEVQRNELFLEALQSRVNALSTDFVNRDDPAQRALIATDRQKALAEMERVRTTLDALKKQIADIEEEARQAGVPPGWLR